MMRADIQVILRHGLHAEIDGLVRHRLHADIEGLVSRGIKAVEIDENGHLIFTLTDGSTVDLGKVVGDDGVSVVNAEIVNGHLIISLSDGTEIDAGSIDASDKHYAYEQTIPAEVWTIQHNLGKYPSVSVVDSAGTVVNGEIRYLDINSLTVTFSGGFSGKAYLN